MNPELNLDCACIAQMSYTLYQAETPLIRSLCIRNLSDDALQDLTVRLTFSPDFAETLELSAGMLPAGETLEIAPVNVILSGEFLRSVTGRTHAQVTAEILSETGTLFSDTIDLDLMPYDPQAANRPVTRQALWERKLLDLSLRNSLLNFRAGSSSVQLIAHDLARLEDETAKGEDMKLTALPEEIHGVQDEQKIWSFRGNAEELRAEAEQAFKSHKLCTCLSEKELGKVLKKLQRAAKVSLEENGANTLYLALGFLRWFETDKSTRPRYAPLVLVPVDIVRKLAGQTYALRARDEDTQVNITLLELLRQDYGIRIDGLDPVPEDDYGVDLPLIFDTIRAAVSKKTGWEIVDLAFLGQFSFSQFIMWNDLRNRSAELESNKIVASLISGALEWAPQSADLSPAELDASVSPSDMAVPTSADSSQLAAIYAASQGESFVLHGPPGTGKSQTITNMIANALYHGKSVLFVAEKMAALSVVQKRLAKLGLDPFCLELHSNKAQKRAVLNQLEHTLNVGRIKSPEEYQSAADDLKRRRMELDGILRALHEPQNIGITLYDAITEWDALRDAQGRLNLPPEFSETTSAAAHAANLELLHRIEAADKELGGWSDSPLKSYCCTDYAPGQREAFSAAVQEMQNVLVTAQQSWQALAADLGLSPQADRSAYEKTLDVLRIAAEGEYLPAALTGPCALTDRSSELDALFADGRQYQKLYADVMAKFDTTILSVNGEKAKLDWKTNEQKWAIPKALGRPKLLKALQIHAKTAGTVTADNYLTICDTLTELSGLLSRLAAADQNLVAGFGALWQRDKSDFDKLDACRAGTITLRKQLASLHDPGVAEALQHPASGCLGAALASQKAFDKTLHTLETTFRIDTSTAADAADWFASMQEEAEGWMRGMTHLRERSALESLLQELEKRGMQPISDAYRSGALTALQLTDAYRAAAANAVIRRCLSDHPELGSLTGTQLDVRMDEYRNAADRFAALTVQELIARLSAKIPAPGEGLKGNSEISILQRAIKSGGRSQSIRKLFESIPQLLHRMCPCMLMSPISVAQYIDPSFPKFDLVIFDEASQLPTSEAVGAIARGENAIIVGDPKQLPPTAFFTSQHFDEDNADKEDLESVLDDCLALSMPSRHLLWHYRSRHESLIAFSNRHFYDGKLLTFPSPDDLISKVTRVPVEGFYDKSKTRQNRAEAEAVVAEIVRRLRDETLRQESLGVVTFSVAQQNLIDDLLTETFVQDPKLEEIANAMYEPLFIKNLENVQGDERDVILFSIGYGPDQNGEVAMNFGPINQDGGWRRLNVAVSRARREMKVFSVIRPDQIDLSRTSAEGVAMLRAFLEFADRGTNAANTAAQEPDAFAQELADALAERGYTVRCGVGSSGYRIDAAVVHPEDPDRFLLALLCGSRQNLDSSSVRDRCISQPSVLRGLGWQVCHVHIPDWLDAPDRVLDRIEAAIRSALEAEQSPAVNESPAQVTYSAERFEHEETPGTAELFYEPTELGTIGSPESFLLPMAQKHIAEAIRTVLAQEAPISRKLLLKRILNAWGMTRTSQKAEAAFDKALTAVEPASTMTGDMPFYWNPDQEPSAFDSVRQGSGADKRSIEEICTEELCAGVLSVLRTQISAPRTELTKSAAKLFGFARMNPAIETAFASAVELAVQRGAAKLDEEQVVLAE